MTEDEKIEVAVFRHQHVLLSLIQYNVMENKTKKLIIEIGESVVKGMFGAVPFAGTALNEAIFDGRSRIKQNRLLNFIKEFSEYLSKFNEEDIDQVYIKSEDFSDIFESIIRRVITFGSKEKLHKFKSILANQVVNSYHTDHAETFLDILSRINEEQIQILDTYRQIKNGDINQDEELSDRNVIDANFEKRVSEIRSAKYFNLDENIYLFYLQDLFSKGLLFDDGINKMDLGPF